jgi:hypothetical protein
MTRHLFAFLALLSGLSALSSPAHASLAEALSCDSSISAAAENDTGSEHVAANSPPTTVSQSDAGELPEGEAVEPTSLRLPVLMGIERAYE